MSVSRQGNKIYLTTDSRTFFYDESKPPLGKGAMGVVYRGVEVGNGRVVAVKRVKDQYADRPEIRHRAHLEASLKFSHPNLVEMIGCCEVAPDRGPLFIISEFVNGDVISTFIDQNIRNLDNPEQRICNLFYPVLDALSYIHQKKIVHMDIKPSNIMVENGRNVRLMDLGIANVNTNRSDISYGMMGTPKYAAPEQFAEQGKKPELSPATDIYEAGVTLYELITRLNPFPNSVDEARRLHQTMVLPKMPSVSDGVLAVIQKATAVDPMARYTNALEMKQALVHALQAKKRKSISNSTMWIILIVLFLIITFIVLMIICKQ